ncbi:SRPBCC family protein [Flavobacterium sp.]
MLQQEKITVGANINAPVEKVWKIWTNPHDIMVWCTADEASWHTPKSENDLRVGGKFTTRMEARDGSFGFDFEGIYDVVDLYKEITYTMGDGRVATTIFTEEIGNTKVATTFDAEGMNPIEMQRDGWQAILNNFKKYVEQN